MNIAGFVLTNVFRDPYRSGLNLLALTIAFLLFTLQRTLAVAFGGDIDLGDIDRLYVIKKQQQSGSLSMPATHRYEIEKISGVSTVTPLNNFRGYYLEPANNFKIEPVEADTYFQIFREWDIDPELHRKFSAIRIGAIATYPLAEKYGWKTGDLITFTSTLWPQEDIGWDWEFEYLGNLLPVSSHVNDQYHFLFRYEYFNEAVWDNAKDKVRRWVVKVDDQTEPREVKNRIDQHFQNSPEATLTTTSDDMLRDELRQLGDIGLITTTIILAVFSSLTLLIGTTLMQAVRDRVPEFAVLKTVGFTPGVVACLCSAESVCLWLLGGMLGVAAALAIEPLLVYQLGPVIGALEITFSTVSLALGLALSLGIAVGLIPALASYRLTIVQALV